MKRELFSKEEEKKLIRLIRQGEKKGASAEAKKQAEEALELLADKCQSLVASMVNFYQGRGKTVIELRKASNLGLIKAMKHYQLHYDFPFSAYATWWIRAEIHKKLGLPVNPEKYGEKEKK